MKFVTYRDFSFNIIIIIAARMEFIVYCAEVFVVFN